MNNTKNIKAIIPLLGLLLVLMISAPLFAVEQDAQQEYQQDLTAFLKAAVAQDAPSVQSALGKLDIFLKDHPGSPLSDDIEFIILVNAFGADDFRLSEWESFSGKYPDGQVEEVTKNAYREIIGAFPSEMNLPYAAWVFYVKANMARSSSDWSAAAENYRQVVKGIDISVPQQKEAAFPSYAMILLSFKKLGDRGAFDSVKNEMIGVYPEKKAQLEGVAF